MPQTSARRRLTSLIVLIVLTAIAVVVLANMPTPQRYFFDDTPQQRLHGAP